MFIPQLSSWCETYSHHRIQNACNSLDSIDSEYQNFGSMYIFAVADPTFTRVGNRIGFRAAL